jgi:hypothetical protein
MSPQQLDTRRQLANLLKRRLHLPLMMSRGSKVLQTTLHSDQPSPFVGEIIVSRHRAMAWRALERTAQPYFRHISCASESYTRNLNQAIAIHSERHASGAVVGGSLRGSLRVAGDNMPPGLSGLKLEKIRQLAQRERAMHERSER